MKMNQKNFGKELERKIAEKTPIFGLARKMPLFVVNSRAYFCSELNKASPNVFIRNSERRSLDEGPLLESLERIPEDLNKNYTEYRAIILDELNKNKPCNFKPVTVNDEYHTGLIRFALNEVFPYFRKDDSEILDSVLEIEQENPAAEFKQSCEYSTDFEKYLKETIDVFEKSRNREVIQIEELDSVLFDLSVSQNQSNSLVSRIVGGLNFGIVDGQVHYLDKLKSESGRINKNGEAILRFEKNRYSLLPFCSLENLEMLFTRTKFEEVYLEVLMQTLESEIADKRIRVKKEELNDLLNKNSYHEQDFGFEVTDKGLLLYLDVPDYVLESPVDRNYYRFDKHRVGIVIGKNGKMGTPVLLVNPFSVEKVEGPFYNDGRLCMGKYKKDYFSFMESGKAFAKLLIDARNIVMSGYNFAQLKVFHELDLEHFSHREIPFSEIKKRGLQITNKGYLGVPYYVPSIDSDSDSNDGGEYEY